MHTKRQATRMYISREQKNLHWWCQTACASSSVTLLDITWPCITQEFLSSDVKQPVLAGCATRKQHLAMMQTTGDPSLPRQKTKWQMLDKVPRQGWLMLSKKIRENRVKKVCDWCTWDSNAAWHLELVFQQQLRGCCPPPRSLWRR